VPAGNPSPLLAGGAWGPSGPPVYGAISSRFAATHRPPPRYAVALLSTATEADAMNEFDIVSSYTVVEPINDDTPPPDLNSLLGILKRMRGCEGVDGPTMARNRCVTRAPHEPGEDRA